MIGKLKTYHILYGTFPLDLRPLVHSGLVRPNDLEDDQGREVAFEAFDQGFVLGLAEHEEYAPMSSRSRFAVTGDFLLDPDFLRVEGETGGTAVQVLD